MAATTIVDSVQATLRDMVAAAFVNPKNVTPALVIQLAAQLASVVNPIKELSGSQKKQLVLGVLKDAVAMPKFAEVAGAEVQTTLNAFIVEVLPSTIDVVIDAARGKYDLAKTVEVASDCFCLALSFLPAARAAAPAPAK